MPISSVVIIRAMTAKDTAIAALAVMFWIMM